ncbi:hypothetical protein BU24DRAFT_429207 [Aaosphaeria arxii CBS 175.79]|uniref:Zn(2)-C6 fungal-type domain-containing protein n=1 Tax=Aaosphaeria arxii CBS 175.79 TaxID=1450172 RepID=A0A6A5X751_9PLEO|nr:uncharacterized protein BU24DRAFT_429207 [Aaosphaeria arxii CBS 175.79]KAF2008614.1 hypothetical protein BU24DRAFT_429207 [Aaosphaeria arxii CBS 175.79]
MKLACARCKTKKIKCDKAEGACHNCAMAQANCVYLERRPKPRIMQNSVGTLSRRLEMLEARLRRTEGAATAPPSSDSPSLSHSTSPAGSEPFPVSGFSHASNENDSFIYDLASHAKHTFEQANASRHASSVCTPSLPGADSAIRDLSDALEQLANLKVRANPSEPGCHELSISRDIAKASVKDFLDSLSFLFEPGSTAGPFDVSILHFMPEIVQSPHVQIDPVMRVLYYNALYFGLHRQSVGQVQEQAQAAYYKCLEAVPQWLHVARGSIPDVFTACFTTWLAINNFDYQLAWKFHCQSCQFVTAAGIHRLDMLPAQSHEEEDQRNALRCIYWHVLQTDFLFRMSYGKPSALPRSTDTVNPPSLLTRAAPHPSRSSTALYVVWFRCTLMTKDLFKLIDSRAPGDTSDDIPREVDEYCRKLEDLLAEWDLEGLAKSPSESSAYAYLLADLAITIHMSIMGVKRMMRRPQDRQTSDSVSLRAARNIVGLILHFSPQPSTMMCDTVGFAFTHFISFYPFCAVFALYEHVFTSAGSKECEADIQALERIGAVMERASNVHTDFVSLSRIFNSLNRISKITLDDQRRNAGATSENYPAAAPGAQSQISRDPISDMETGTTTDPQSAQQEPIMPPLQGVGALQPRMQGSYLSHFPGDGSGGLDIQMHGTMPSFEDGFEPLSLVRALESDIMEKNWHDEWWEVDNVPCDTPENSNMTF